MDDAINDISEAIISARDFCGDERQAAKDWCSENGVAFTEPLFAEALRLADAAWAEHQRAAGVTPLTPAERTAAYRDIRHG